MADYPQKDQMPTLPDWMKQYDISVGPYDQPVPSRSRRDEQIEDKKDHRDQHLEKRGAT